MSNESLNDDVRALHKAVIDAWNRRDAVGFAAPFAPDGGIVGFDGSFVNGRSAIEAHVGGIFADHQPAAYVTKVREVRGLGSDGALLRAVVGMVPPGNDDINPDVNAVQTLVAERGGDSWRIAMLQSTPAAFHGRPEESEQLTEELRRELQDKPTA